MKLHALVSDLETAKIAVEGATVLQLRLKGRPTQEVVDEGRPFRHLCALHGITFVVNDDCEAAVELGADGVHLGHGDEGAEAAVEAGLMLGTSAATIEEAVSGERIGAAYIGAGVWATPTKPDADPPIGSTGWPRSVRPCPSRSSPSAESMRPTPPTVSRREQPGSR